MTRSFVHRLRVRYSECDPQGVVFNAHYITYFDIALTELWREAIGPFGAMVEAGTDMVVAEVRARYLAPAGFDDLLEVAVAPTRLGNTAMITRIEVRCDGDVVVEGEMRHVFVDTATRRKREIPNDVRCGLERYVLDSESASAGAGGGGGGDRAQDGEPPAPPDLAARDQPAGHGEHVTRGERASDAGSPRPELARDARTREERARA